MGTSASKELVNDGQPSRLNDITETLQSVMVDFMQEQMTEANIAERREEIEKEQKEQQQVQQGMAAALAAAGAELPNQQQLHGEEGSEIAVAAGPAEAEDPFPPVPVPTLGIAVELCNKSTSAGGEQVETVHRVWVALTIPGAGLGDDGAKEASSALSQAAHLELLDLGYNDLSALGAQYICPALAASVAGRECLRFLRLSGNDIGVAGARAVAEMVKGNSSNNSNGSEQEAEVTGGGGGIPYLEELQVYNCGITDEGVHALVNALRTHDYIRSINIGKNPTTRKSILMLTELAKRCKTLVNVRVDVTPSANGNSGAGAPAPVKESDYAELEAALEANRGDEARRNETRAVLEAKAQRREQQRREETQRQEAEAREEREKIQARVRELEAAQRQHEEDVRRLAALEAEKESQAQARKTAQKAAESSEALDRAMTQAYDWRNKLGVSTGKAAIYRDGFSLYTRQQYVDENGLVRERMVSYDRNPTRLRACWCDPPDAAVPYARKLHYHCKYESASTDLLGTTGGKDGAAGDAAGGGAGGGTLSSDLPKYIGCRGSGHICASVGYHTKALPNKSAAYFFSSQHPSFQDEQVEDDVQGW